VLLSELGGGAIAPPGYAPGCNVIGQEFFLLRRLRL